MNDLANLGWLITGLFVCFVIGGLVGWRLGVIHGYDRAEEMLEQIAIDMLSKGAAPFDRVDTEQYRKMKQEEKSANT